MSKNEDLFDLFLCWTRRCSRGTIDHRPLEELAHAAANPGFKELCKLCPGAARCKPTAARCKAAKRAFVERYRTWLGLRRPRCISY